MRHVHDAVSNDLTTEQWQRLEGLLAMALELPPDERCQFLDRECKGEFVLRAELDSLLHAQEMTGPLDRPLVLLTGSRVDPPGAEPAPGTVIFHYELQHRLGGGGMGVVYRARDLRLERTVALKFLPPALSEDVKAKNRFLREARAAAALEHTNVCTIHEIGETPEGQLFISMAFVDGQSLRQIINQRRLPPELVIEIARQIAAGLMCAHSRGIVHRDIKPANIMVGTDGVIKIVDFGIAKLAGLTLTDVGITPGTVAYMSPEQARGEVVDHRTDLWALGVIMYEMLAERRPFDADNHSAVLHAITNVEPERLLTLRPDIPAELDSLVSRALTKNQEQRFESAKEMRDALRRISDKMRWQMSEGNVGLLFDVSPELAEPRAKQRPAVVQRSARSLSPTFVFVLLTTGILGFYLWLRTDPPSPAETFRLSVSTPGVVTPQLSVVISPDGRKLAFVATDASGDALLWVRALDQLAARPLPGTEHAAHPFWSPDGKSLGFIADSRLKRVDIDGGPVQILAETLVRGGPAWGPDGSILFPTSRDEFALVPSTGGTIRSVLKADPTKKELSLGWPRFLPDGRHFIYFAYNEQPEHRGIYVGSLDSKDTKFILRSDFRAWYAPPGYLVFPRDETLLAQPFDLTRLELYGQPKVIAEGIWVARLANQASFSLSETGALAYINAHLWDGELAWYDRAGRPLGTLGPPVRYEGRWPQISPDGRRIAIARGESGRQNIWILGANGEGTTRLTINTEDKGLPVWAADGQRVMFYAGSHLVVKDVDTGAEEIIPDSVFGVLADWSRDGRFVLLNRFDSHSDLWVIKLDGDKVPFPFIKTPYNETQAQLSPDARWIAYTSNESGRDEVFVQSFPSSGHKRQVSVNGGAMPRWRRDGKELFYLAGNQFLTAVPILNPESLELGRPTPLFRTRLVVEGSESIGLQTRYDVAPDGERFLLRYTPIDPGPPITVVINWLNALNP